MRPIAHSNRRAGKVVVLVTLLLPVMAGSIGFAFDLTWVMNGKRQLQSATDSCALAVAHHIANDSPDVPYSQLVEWAHTQGSSWIGHNSIDYIQLIAENAVVETGMFPMGGDAEDFEACPSPCAPPSEPLMFDAVRVITHMTGEQSMPAHFGKIFGIQQYQPSAMTIVLMERYPGALLPFTMSKESWNDAVQGASDLDGISEDLYGYDANSGDVVEAADGLHEVSFYPLHANQPTGCASGNWGALSLDNNGNTQDLEDQIEIGVTLDEVQVAVEELAAMNSPHTGPFSLVTITDPVDGYPVEHFYEGATQVSYWLPGNTGISSGIKETFKARVGQVVALFVHSDCIGQGSNSAYHIIELRYGRLMAVNLTNDKKVILQPIDDISELQGPFEVLGLGY